MANLLKKSYEGRTVFITGHAGFMGSWLAYWLHSMGANVVGYSLEQPNKDSLYHTVSLNNKIIDIVGNINDISSLNKKIALHKPEYVFHLAAQPLVRISYEIPVDTFQTNVMGTINVLESIRQNPNIKSCVIVTSDKCYKNREDNYAYKEDDPMGGFDPYSASKGAAELVVSSYKNSFFNNTDTAISTVRAGNILGGGDWAFGRIIPDSIKSLHLGKPIKVHHPNAVRPWQYVLEPIYGMLLLASKMKENSQKFSQAWNFGPLMSNRKIPVKELVNMVIEKWGGGNWIDVSHESTLLHEANLLMLDSTKAIHDLNWMPALSLEDSISETVSWYKAFFNDPKSVEEFTLNQIHNYVKKARIEYVLE